MEGDDPITMAVATAASAGISAGGAVMGGVQAKQAAVQQGRQDTEEATVAKMQAGAEVSSETENAAKTISRAEALGGAAGMTAASATPILSEDYTQAKIKAAYTRFNGNLAATEDIYAAKYAKWRGQQAFWGGIFGGTQAALGGVIGVGKIGQQAGWWGNGAPPPPSP